MPALFVPLVVKAAPVETKRMSAEFCKASCEAEFEPSLALPLTSPVQPPPPPMDWTKIVGEWSPNVINVPSLVRAIA